MTKIEEGLGRIGAPKTTCAPSSHEVTTVVMKNCEPFVFFPAFAIESRPGFVCLILKFSSVRHMGTSQIVVDHAAITGNCRNTRKHASEGG